MSHYWVDVDNPPQAQYLSPIARALRERGHDVLLTARDHAPTLEVLANRGETAVPVSGTFGPSTFAKAAGTLTRVARLRGLVKRRIGCPAGAVSTSRSGVLAARTLGSPVFTVLDYEGVELDVFRRSGTTILHPSVIPPHRFVERGFPADRLSSFPGLKEDLAFSGLDLAVGPAHLPSPRDAELPAVLVRPPSETSHYSTPRTTNLLSEILDQLAQRRDIQVVFSPRDPAQKRHVTARDWACPPVVLERQLPAVPLIKSVDLLITGGGTMLREAAWLGTPAMTLFQGPLPAVDLWLEGQGAVARLTSGAQFDSRYRQLSSQAKQITRNPDTLGIVVDAVTSK